MANNMTYYKSPGRKYLKQSEAVRLVAALREAERQLPFYPLHKSDYHTVRHIELEAEITQLSYEIVSRLSGSHPEQIA